MGKTVKEKKPDLRLSTLQSELRVPDSVCLVLQKRPDLIPLVRKIQDQHRDEKGRIIRFHEDVWVSQIDVTGDDAVIFHLATHYMGFDDPSFSLIWGPEGKFSYVDTAVDLPPCLTRVIKRLDATAVCPLAPGAQRAAVPSGGAEDLTVG